MRACKKLNSTRGASLLFAILVFMLCAFAGLAALTAAASNAGRFTHAQHDQQQYLSVASAVDLLREELCPPKLEFSQQLVKTYTWHYENGNQLKSTTAYAWGDETTPWPDGDEVTAPTLFERLLKDTCLTLFEGEIVPADWYTMVDDEESESPEEPTSFTARELTLTGNGNLSRLAPVYATVALEQYTYNLVITLWTGEGHAYETTVVIPAETTYDLSAETRTERATDADGNEIDSGVTTTTTTVTFTLEWHTENATVTQNKEGTP